MNPDRRRSLREVVDFQILKGIWQKSIRKRLRQTRFPDFVIGHDATEWAAVDWEIDEILAGLRRSVLAETYRSFVPELVTGAKSKGLTRPLAFLQVSDLILFKALVLATQSRLHEFDRPWTGSGRTDAKEPEAADYPGASWFLRWLQTDRAKWHIVSTSDLIVESDIASFFPSIDLRMLYNALAVYSSLDLDALNLLLMLLLGLLARPGFDSDAQRGLPIEDHDCSRTLAHFFLKPLDDEFEREGGASSYTRFVDDMALGATSKIHAARLAGRIQKTLESLNLTLNSAKTQFFSAEAFAAEYCQRGNDEVAEFEWLARDSPDGFDMSSFDGMVELLLSTQSRPRGWTRVLRRCCTLSRKMRSECLLKYLPGLFYLEPSAARHLAEYRASFPITHDDIQSIAQVYKEWSGLYEEIDSLLFELVAIAPNDDSPMLRAAVAEFAGSIASDLFSTSPRVSASALVCFGKFAEIERAARIVQDLKGRLRFDTPARQHLALVSCGLGVWSVEDAVALLPDPSGEAARHLRFLSAIERGDPRATGAAIEVMRPSEKREPDRFVLRSRGLFLARSLRKGNLNRWLEVSKTWRPRIERQSAEYRDLGAVRVLDWPSQSWDVSKSVPR